ncbi:hypothetical protein A2917_00365 [Candidatus Nomurabacteria bacterium RIFCSPLOWO2_01_FULL_42_17]|uniref:Uncharacterized protein n=1 Tax=Candidatus Nomurabacteria bacterium RIFCSPLOWO2_01_FULL_42_17 TaxID=1801780 RepID=A0A1F6XNQ4_9BACT|nr:MAG: hypothetical protein A2917_00365 [Candidatus Nomurabacteria bacterium RIFCSPLOWO2_01_FULL_42_17]
MKKHLLTALGTLTLGLIIGASAISVMADWTNPPSSPPNENTPAPLNVGGIGQTKQASLWLKGLNDAGQTLANGLIVENGNVGIGVIAPAAKLDVSGQTKTSTFQMTTGAGANKVLTSDASGNASWATGATTAERICTAPLSTSGNPSYVAVTMLVNGQNICADDDGCTIWGTTIATAGTLRNFEPSFYKQLANSTWSSIWAGNNEYVGTQGEGTASTVFGNRDGTWVTDDRSGTETSSTAFSMHDTTASYNMTVVVCD